MKNYKLLVPAGILLIVVIFMISRSGKRSTQVQQVPVKGAVAVSGAKSPAVSTSAKPAAVDISKAKELTSEATDYRRKGDYAGAIKLLEEGLRGMREKEEIYLLSRDLAVLYEKTKQYDLAIEKVRKMAEANQSGTVQKAARSWIGRLEIKKKQ